MDPRMVHVASLRPQAQPHVHLQLADSECDHGARLHVRARRLLKYGSKGLQSIEKHAPPLQTSARYSTALDDRADVFRGASFNISSTKRKCYGRVNVPRVWSTRLACLLARVASGPWCCGVILGRRSAVWLHLSWASVQYVKRDSPRVELSSGPSH